MYTYTGREGVPVVVARTISMKLNVLVVHPVKTLKAVSEPEKRRSPATTSIVPLNPTML